ncbi:glycoside hydrolase family 26 protein [Pinibacter soli]|uniref:Mannan endo-1,4-beta-mannosidase n=1 Tax=Pinibacter soli TaxID=3044211 RepID=A0ABT6RAW8_9BACT|nr:glycosyl hydrolase [Pinibacter soli]MDI3319551.1 glycosyl hydrolase [Pinibacter soli]
MLKTNAIILLLLSLAGHVFAQDLPCDKDATKETVNLYKNLKRSAQKGYLFGHQDDLAYGVGWKYEKGRSDVKDVVNDYPGIYGWELGGIEYDKPVDLDSVPFDKMKGFIEDAYNRGGVITISWHLHNPFNGKTAWSTDQGSVASILPGAEKNELFKTWLDKVAAFLLSLKGKNGEAVPVLFRPYHELTGNWFWWGRTACTPYEFKQLWRFTINYLQKEKGVHNLLYVYNTGGDFTTANEFLERYPGDDVADVLSMDAYQTGDPSKDDSFVKHANSNLQILGTLAKEKNKIFAFAETGYEAIPYAQWWTNTLAKAIGDNKIAYVLVWRNHGLMKENGRMHYYAPYKGQVSADDFMNFYKMKNTLFEKDAKKEKLYN